MGRRRCYSERDKDTKKGVRVGEWELDKDGNIWLRILKIDMRDEELLSNELTGIRPHPNPGEISMELHFFNDMGTKNIICPTFTTREK